MTFQKIGMVWHVETNADFAAIDSPTDGMIVTIDGTDGVNVGNTYIWTEGPGWVTLYGERLAPEFDIPGDFASNNAVMFIFGNTITATASPPGGIGDNFVVAVVDGEQQPTWVTPAYYQASPADPTGTTGTDVMMGIAAALTTDTGRCIVDVCGTLKNSGTDNVASAQIRYGTGSAPTNGAAATGTAVGTKIAPTLATNRDYPFSLTAIIDGLSVPDIPIWIDLALSASAGTTSVKYLTVTARDF